VNRGLARGVGARPGDGERSVVDGDTLSAGADVASMWVVPRTGNPHGR
jgi:hypothetical protein